MGHRILRRMGREVLELALRDELAVADADEEISVGVERELRAVVSGPLAPGVRFEDFLDVVQRVVLETRSQEGSRALGIVRVALGVAQVDQAVGLEVGVHRDFLEAALSLVADRRQGADRIRQQFAVANDPEPSRPLGDEDVAIGQEGDAPRVLEPVGNDLDGEVVLLRLNHLGAGRRGGDRECRGGGEPDRSLYRARAAGKGAYGNRWREHGDPLESLFTWLSGGQVSLHQEHASRRRQPLRRPVARALLESTPVSVAASRRPLARRPRNC